MNDNPYQMYVYLGPSAPRMNAGATLVDITPDRPGVDAALAAIEKAGLTAADLRTRTLFIADPSLAAADVVVSYAALCGFAGRFVDFTLLADVTETRRLSQPLIEAVDAGKTEPRPEIVQFGAGSEDPRVLHYPTVGELTVEQVSEIRSARRAVVHVAGLSASDALELFVIAASLRARGSNDRYPLLLSGTQTISVDPDADPSAAPVVGIDLDTVRRAAADLRRARRTDDRDALVDKPEPTERDLRLLQAAATPIDQILVRLGSHLDNETGFWRCPRPDRHRNGDANPSSRLFDNSLRCFRCDAEAVDPLRLVMDVHAVGPDDAADWILATARH